MSNLTLLAPLFVHVTLIFVLLVWLGRSRVRLAKDGTVKLKDVALSTDGWPRQSRKIANSYRIQFELPMLFYGIAALIIATGTNGPVLVALAWAFVAVRIVHALIHTGSNRVRHRFNAFLAGFASVRAARQQSGNQ